MSDQIRLARTADGRIVRDTDRDAAIYVGRGSVDDLTASQPHDKTEAPAPPKQQARRTTQRKKPSK